MASYQRVALFVFFDALELDLISRILELCQYETGCILVDAEREKATSRLSGNPAFNLSSDFDLLHGVDLEDKLSIIARLKDKMDAAFRGHFLSIKESLGGLVPIRNATMHGRPLTIEQYSRAFSVAETLCGASSYWPNLAGSYREFSENPHAFVDRSVPLLDDDTFSEVLNNLPVPDYDDTGFLPRPGLEKDLRKKILGRHPVITVLGQGGNGKTALALQTLYGLLHSGDHDYDAFAWVSAKSTVLTITEIKRIEGAITDSLGIFSEVAELFEPGDGDGIDRVRKLLEENKVLLIIDNLETVLDETLRAFASDIPGESKLLFTSRVPLGSDLSVNVPELSDREALTFMRRLIEAYDIGTLRRASDDRLKSWANRVSRNPLLLKWFSLAVSQGTDPDRIVADPKLALQYCMENVFERLLPNTRTILTSMSILPGAVSAPILNHTTELDPMQIEEALAELLRYGLVERVQSSDYERLFNVRTFTRAYLSKLFRAPQEEAERTLSRFREIEAAYQKERGGERHNRYNVRTYTVRSRSEALAARKLKQAIRLNRDGAHADANKIVDEVKITSPEYFEVYRIEAFLAFDQGDIPRAKLCYETAFDLSKNQPQLHFYYGGFLLRAYNDYEGAAEQFEKALDSDPFEAAVLREAARAKFFLFDFDGAQEFITRAGECELKTLRDEVIVNDLQVQLYVRKSEHLLESGDIRGAFEALASLNTFLFSLPREVVDDLMAGHLEKALQTVEMMKRHDKIADATALNEVTRKIGDLVGFRKLTAPGAVKGTSMMGAMEFDGRRTGRLKSEGRSENFGFLRDLTGGETYINRKAVTADLWQWMIDSKPVEYRVTTHADGKTSAIGVTRVLHSRVS